MIITLTNGNRMDGDLCCGQLGCDSQLMWQPADRDPCLDDWWCRSCRTWSEPIACGPRPMMVHRFDELSRSALSHVCA